MICINCGLESKDSIVFIVNKKSFSSEDKKINFSVCETCWGNLIMKLFNKTPPSYFEEV